MDARRRTKSFDSLMSAQLAVDSHTSRNRILTASASALASSSDAIVKRNTTSSPYLARMLGDGKDASFRLPFPNRHSLEVVCRLGGTPHIASMIPFLILVR